MNQINPHLRRLAALTLLAALIMGIYAISLGPFLSAYTGNIETAAQLQTALEKYRQIAARLPAVTQTLTSLRATRSDHQGYLDGTDEAVAAALLQDRLKTLIARTGGRLQSTQAMPQAKTAGKPQQIGLRAHMVLQIDELQAVLYELENGNPVLFIEALNIRAISASAAEHGLLDVTFDIIGYLPEAGQ